MNFRFKKGDVILIAGVLLLASVAAIARAPGGNAGAGAGGGVSSVVITVDGALWREVPLHTDSRIIFDEGGRHNTLVIENGSVRMESADCPDGLCIKQGVISDAGSVIVCLPNRFAARLSKTAPEDPEVDVIAG